MLRTVIYKLKKLFALEAEIKIVRVRTTRVAHYASPRYCDDKKNILFYYASDIYIFHERERALHYIL